MPTPRAPVILSAATRVLRRAAQIAAEDAAIAAGPAAVQRSRRRRKEDNGQAFRAPPRLGHQSAVQQAAHAHPEGSSAASAAVHAAALEAQKPLEAAVGEDAQIELADEEDCPHDLTAVTRWSLSDPLDYELERTSKSEAKNWRALARGSSSKEVDEEDCPHDLAAFSLSDPLDSPKEPRRLWSKPPQEDNDPHDLSAYTRWSLGDPVDYQLQRRQETVEVHRPSRPTVSIRPAGSDDNGPQDLAASTRWSLGDPIDYDMKRRRGEAVEVKRPTRPKVPKREVSPPDEEGCPHDMTASTRWSLGDPIDYDLKRRSGGGVEIKRPSGELMKRVIPEYEDVAARPPPAAPAGAEEEDCPADMSAATKWSLGEPVDYDAKRRLKQVSRTAEVDEEDCPADLTAATRWSLGEPLDYDARGRQSVDAPRPARPAPPTQTGATGLEEEDCPHDLSAATRWSLGEPVDYDAKRRLKELNPAPAPAMEEDCPADLSASTRWSLGEPVDYDAKRKLKEVKRPARPAPAPSATEEEESDHPTDLSAATRWSLGDPVDLDMKLRQAKSEGVEAKRPTRPAPPPPSPVEADDTEDKDPCDLSAATSWSLADPTDMEFKARELKSQQSEAKPASPAEAAAASSSTSSLDAATLAPAPQASTSASSLDSEPPAPDPEVEMSLGMEDPEEEPVALRSSTVPTSRLGRLFHYGTLGAGLAWGAASESLRRTRGGSGTGSVFMSDANVRRLVATLGRMRGAALKLGQFMSIQDNNMLPPEIERVLHQVQQHANYMPDWQMEKSMKTELGANWEEKFATFERTPVAAASIGQVHRATLKDGTPVAIKIQFPGVAGSINSDLANISLLLRGSAVLPKGLYLQNTIAVMRRELEDECDYIREGEAGKKFHHFLKDDPVFVVPRVIDEATTGKVLTTEWMGGRPLSKMKGMTQSQRDLIGESILRLCLRELFQFRFMQTDPNWGNFLFDKESNKIQLIDFGASREYTKEFMDGWYRLLQAALDGEKGIMKTESESLGYLTGEEEQVMVDAHLASMTALARPFQHPGKYDFVNQTITEEVRALIPVMLKHRLTPPPAPTYSLNRKLSGAFLMCSKLGARVDCQALWKEVVGDYKEGPEPAEV